MSKMRILEALERNAVWGPIGVGLAIAGFGYLAYSAHPKWAVLLFVISAFLILTGSAAFVFEIARKDRTDSNALSPEDKQALDELLSENALAALKSSGDRWAFGLGKNEILPEIAAEFISAELMDVEGIDRLRLNGRGVRIRNHLLMGANPRPKWQIVRPESIVNVPTLGTPTVVVSAPDTEVPSTSRSQERA